MFWLEHHQEAGKKKKRWKFSKLQSHVFPASALPQKHVLWTKLPLFISEIAPDSFQYSNGANGINRSSETFLLKIIFQTNTSVFRMLWKVWSNFQAHDVPLPASTNCWCFSLQGCIFDNTDVIYWAHFVVACKNGQFAIYNFYCFSQVLWSWESQKPLTNVSSWKVRAAQECQRTWLASSLSQSKSLDFIILNFNNF